jgi:hypothetical protein
MEAFEDLKASLTWGATLELSDEQRAELRGLCAKIVGDFVPSWRLKQEADKRRAAEEPFKALVKRVEALEAALKEKRAEFVFRRGKHG